MPILLGLIFLLTWFRGGMNLLYEYGVWNRKLLFPFTYNLLLLLAGMLNLLRGVTESRPDDDTQLKPTLMQIGFFIVILVVLGVLSLLNPASVIKTPKAVDAHLDELRLEKVFLDYESGILDSRKLLSIDETRHATSALVEVNATFIVGDDVVPEHAYIQLCLYRDVQNRFHTFSWKRVEKKTRYDVSWCDDVFPVFIDTLEYSEVENYNCIRIC
ncbi:MAG: hypothetical protein GF334_10905 [Candidatus Altiarchaeales archaeon]|nr:hypothetical protein [Candidatus Altiarchaeales archaeon]